MMMSIPTNILLTISIIASVIVAVAVIVIIMIFQTLYSLWIADSMYFCSLLLSSRLHETTKV